MRAKMEEREKKKNEENSFCFAIDEKTNILKNPCPFRRLSAFSGRFRSRGPEPEKSRRRIPIFAGTKSISHFFRVGVVCCVWMFFLLCWFLGAASARVITASPSTYFDILRGTSTFGPLVGGDEVIFPGSAANPTIYSTSASFSSLKLSCLCGFFLLLLSSPAFWECFEQQNSYKS